MDTLMRSYGKLLVYFNHLDILLWYCWWLHLLFSNEKIIQILMIIVFLEYYFEFKHARMKSAWNWKSSSNFFDRIDRLDLQHIRSYGTTSVRIVRMMNIFRLLQTVYIVLPNSRKLTADLSLPVIIRLLISLYQQVDIGIYITKI